jgi:RNA methyltransferase, TrmH family
LVLGSEGQGLSSTALDNCSSISVPMDGDMESLNVAVAGGILMFALTRAPESLTC